MYDYIVSAFSIVTYECYGLYPELRFDENKTTTGYRMVSRERRPGVTSRGVICDPGIY
jgi:hypothetical protein